MMKVRVLVDIKAEPFQANGRATRSKPCLSVQNIKQPAS